MLRRIAIVGASLAGLRTAEALRHQGYDGVLTLVGDEPDEPYDRPPLSKQFLAGRVDREQVRLAPQERLAALDLDLRLGVRAEAVDVAAHTVAVAGGDLVRFDALVVATGARPRTLPGTEGRRNVHVLRTLADAARLRAAVEAGASRIAVVGAGFIGAEVAATLRRRGCSVTLIEPLPVPLARALRPELGAVVEHLHRDEGVDVRCATTVAELVGNPDVGAVVLGDGERVEVDAVVVGIGVTPNTEWLAASGLRLADGVVCDATLRAAGGADVWAVGDVARWQHPLLGAVRIEHWTNAVDHADGAAANILAGAAAAPVAPVPYVWSDQYRTKIQILGRPAADDDLHIVHGSPEQRRFVALCGREGRLSAVIGFSSPRLVMPYQRLLAERTSMDGALAFARSQAPPVSG